MIQTETLEQRSFGIILAGHRMTPSVGGGGGGGPTAQAQKLRTFYNPHNSCLNLRRKLQFSSEVEGLINRQSVIIHVVSSGYTVEGK